jgi:hypothetical protein
MQEVKHKHIKQKHAKFEAHFVAVWNLRVWVTEENGWFFAQGLEVDYAAQGSSLEEVMEIFHEGFVRSIDAHLREHGNVRAFLKPVSAEILMEFNAHKGDSKPVRTMSLHVTETKQPAEVPTTNIDFYELPKAA